MGVASRFADWFVRRAGLARFTTIALAFGFVLAAFTGAQILVAVFCLGATLLVLIVHVGLVGQIPKQKNINMVSSSPEMSSVSGKLQVDTQVSLILVVSVILLGLFSGYLLGTIRVSMLEQSKLSNHFDTRITAQVTVTGVVRTSEYGQNVTAVVAAAQLDQTLDFVTINEEIYLQVPAQSKFTPAITQGQQLLVKGTIKEPKEESGSGFNQKIYLRNRGIQVVLSASKTGVEILGCRGGVRGWFDGVRAAARVHLSCGPSDRLDEVLKGVVMGDTSGIEESWLEAFRRAGTAHMFAVSGLHVGALAAIMLGLAGLLRLPRSLGFLLAAGAAFLMIPFVGESPPVVRAVVMISVVLFARWVGRGRDGWQILALAAAVVLGMNPYSVFDVGFQLSFAAFGGIFALIGWLEKVLHFLYILKMVLTYFFRQ